MMETIVSQVLRVPIRRLKKRKDIRQTSDPRYLPRVTFLTKKPAIVGSPQTVSALDCQTSAACAADRVLSATPQSPEHSRIPNPDSLTQTDKKTRG